MKAHLTKVSLALLSTVFLLGCQDLGSGAVGPEGPQFNKPTDGKHDHGDDVVDPTDPTFAVKVTGDDVKTVPEEQTMTGSSFFKEDFFLDISFFNDFGVEDGDPCTLSVEKGLFSVANGDAGGPHVHVVFEFMHKEIKHTLAMDGVPVPLNEVWDPEFTRTAENAESGHWTMTAKGKGHQNGCKGEEDGTLGNGDEVSFMLTIVPQEATP